MHRYSCTGLLNLHPAFRLKTVYSYVIEVADSKSDLVLHGRALVSEIMVFLRIRVTCIFQLNDFFCTTIREIASINTPSKVNTLHTPSKVNTLNTPS